MDGHWVRRDDGDEGFADGDSPDDEAVPMDTNLAVEGEDELLNGPRASVFYTVPQDDGSNEDKGAGFSKQEVEEMMKSEAYQKKIDTCHLCGQCWFEAKFSPDCTECDGGHMTKPCPVCEGQCNQIWTRDVKKSHSLHKAIWEGSCKIIKGQRSGTASDRKAKTLTEGMQDLSTR